jgi:hypothetical protein
MSVFVNIPFENKIVFGFAVGVLVPRAYPCRYFIRGRSETGCVAYMSGGPVPTTKLHGCAGRKGRGDARYHDDWFHQTDR